LGVTAALAIEGATVRFDDVAALAGVDLSVARGEVVAVLGPSGSGKSTLLRAVAGLQQLDTGTISLGGRDLTGVPPHRRGVGLMFQDHALFPHRDVAGNVGFGLRMQGRPAPEVATRVSALLDLVDLPGFHHRRVQTLSGGEQQRVALARALAPEPEVLLLDEPLGALDRTLREHLVTELRSLFTRLGLTVVAVTHDHAEAFSIADRVVVMDAGQVLQEGTPARVWERPRTRRVAQLLGFANIVDVEVVAGQAVTAWGTVSLADVPDGPATVLIPPAAVRLGGSTDGVRGTVVACTFAGDRTSVRVDVDGAPLLDALLPTGAAPGPGEVTYISIKADAAVLLGP
jgi:thiamine transport system ATP-binding protein